MTGRLLPVEGKSLRWFLGAAVFDEASKQLSIGGKSIALEPKPAQVLLLLLHRQGEVVTHSELRHHVWGNRLSVPHVIATAIGKVRNALAAIAEVEVSSVPRIGYRLSGAISRVVVEDTVPEATTLKLGDSLPSAPEFTLVRAIGDGPERLWAARHADTEQVQLFRLAQTEDCLLRLQSEHEQLQALQGILGGRNNILGTVASNLSHPPFFLRYDHCGERLADWPAERLAGLPYAERMALFLGIAEALATLHNAGCLHQALNPGNVLISIAAGTWQACLANYGLRGGRFVTTCAENDPSGAAHEPLKQFSTETAIYLAPELLQGQAHSVTSDVFALGVLLYQFLCGDLRRAIQPGWEREIEDHLLRQDIAAATDVDPTRRTSSVATLAHQLRHLDARRFEAQREHARELALQHAEARLQRLRARRPWMVTVLALLTAIAALAGWLFVEADRGRIAAERYARSAEAVQQFLVEDVFAQSNPAHPQFKREASMADFLDNAARHIDQRFADDPLTLGVLQRVIGASHTSLGNREASIEHYQAAVRILEQQLGKTHDIALDARYGLAHALIFATKFAEASEQLRIADELSGEKLSHNNPIALKSAVYGAQLNTYQFQPEQALPGYERALQLLFAGVPATPEFEGSVRFDYADALLRLNRADAVLSLLATPLNFINDGQRAAHHRLLARAWRAKEDYAAALPHAEAALVLNEKFNGKNHWNTITAMSTLSYLQFLLKNCTAAVPLAEEAYQRMAAREGETKQGTLIELGNRGSRRFACGQHEAGLKDLYSARDLLRQHYGATSPPAQNFAMTLARNLGEMNRYEEALQALATLNSDAAAQIQATGGPSVNSATLQVLHARLLLGAGRADAALRALSPALATLQAPDNQDVTLFEEARDLEGDVRRALLARLPEG